MIEGGRCKRVLESIDDDDGERRIVRIEKEKDQGKALTRRSHKECAHEMFCACALWKHTRVQNVLYSKNSIFLQSDPLVVCGK